jgi:hypothetical protein
MRCEARRAAVRTSVRIGALLRRRGPRLVFVLVVKRESVRTLRLALLACVASLALALVASAVADAPPATTAKRHSCGTYSSTSIYKKAKVIAIRGVSCKRARQVAVAYDRSQRTLGKWRCGLAHDDLPRLFSCGAGKSSGDLRKWPHALEAVGTGARR